MCVAFCKELSEPQCRFPPWHCGAFHSPVFSIAGEITVMLGASPVLGSYGFLLCQLLFKNGGHSRNSDYSGLHLVVLLIVTFGYWYLESKVMRKADQK